MAFLVDACKAMLVRTVLLVHSLLVIWLAASMTGHMTYWLLALALLGMLVEAGVTLLVNRAQEWKWFCPCFFTYLLSTIPGIWILELNRMQLYQQTIASVNTTVLQTGVVANVIEGLDIPVAIETDTLVVIMEQLFLYLMILSRWFLPRGEITRDELSQLLFVFIGIASDITELFALFEENQVRRSTHLTYAILCVWSFSLFQFIFVLTSTNNPNKGGVVMSDSNVRNEDPEEGGCIRELFSTEVWSICVNFLFQDGPFLAIRLYTMIAMKVLTYSIIFFTAKNGLLVMLLVYRLVVLCCERSHRDSQVGSLPPSLSSRDNMYESNESFGKRKQTNAFA